MENEFFYLTYYQVMIFMIRIREMKNENPYFHDEIASSFNNFVINRSKEIAETSPFKLKIMPNANKYKVSKSMVKYLKNLTGIDVLDEKNLEKYIPLIINLEDTTIKKFSSMKRRLTNK